MTAEREGAEVETLAMALHRLRCDMGHKDWTGCRDYLGRGCEADVEALAPLIAERERAAAERALREAAAALWRGGGFTGGVQWGRADYAAWLRDRADTYAEGGE